MTLRDADVDALAEIARAGGEAIMALYCTDVTHATKADASPVTQADIDADAILREGLTAAFPGVPVVSEESAADGMPAGECFFLVDPLDGTREFLNRTDEFTVNIALVSDRRPVAGIVYAPALGELFVAGGKRPPRRYAGAACRDLHVSPFDGGRPLRVMGSRSHGSPALQAWLDTLNLPYTFVAAGSSLKFCRIAEGRADVYPRFGHTSQWDTAAGQAVLEQAGGSVTEFSGTPLCYGRHRPLINPFFTAIGDPCLAALVGGLAAAAGVRPPQG
jgi:3'(2'),5'-bisphosphate nucleotidase